MFQPAAIEHSQECPDVLTNIVAVSAWHPPKQLQFGGIEARVLAIRFTVVIRKVLLQPFEAILLQEKSAGGGEFKEGARHGHAGIEMRPKAVERHQGGVMDILREGRNNGHVKIGGEISSSDLNRRLFKLPYDFEEKLIFRPIIDAQSGIHFVFEPGDAPGVALDDFRHAMKNGLFEGVPGGEPIGVGPDERVVIEGEGMIHRNRRDQDLLAGAEVEAPQPVPGLLGAIVGKAGENQFLRIQNIEVVMELPVTSVNEPIPVFITEFRTIAFDGFHHERYLRLGFGDALTGVAGLRTIRADAVTGKDRKSDSVAIGDILERYYAKPVTGSFDKLQG